MFSAVPGLLVSASVTLTLIMPPAALQGDDCVEHLPEAPLKYRVYTRYMLTIYGLLTLDEVLTLPRFSGS